MQLFPKYFLILLLSKIQNLGQKASQYSIIQMQNIHCLLIFSPMPLSVIYRKT